MRHSFYLGKKVVYIYRAQKEIRGSKIRWYAHIHTALRRHTLTHSSQHLGQDQVTSRFVEVMHGHVSQTPQLISNHRQLGRSQGFFPFQPPSQDPRRHPPSDALPQQHISAAVRDGEGAVVVLIMKGSTNSHDEAFGCFSGSRRGLAWERTHAIARAAG